MNTKNLKIALITIIFLVCSLFLSSLCMGFKIDIAPNISAISKLGDKGEDVKTIQNKLKEQGYYNDSVDGVFGEVTKNALIKFQKDKGLTADGIISSL